MTEKKEKFNMLEYQKEYNKKFIKENYDTITLRLAKGKRETIKAKAESLSMSVNAYILSLINKDLEE